MALEEKSGIPRAPALQRERSGGGGEKSASHRIRGQSVLEIINGGTGWNDRATEEKKMRLERRVVPLGQELVTEIDSEIAQPGGLRRQRGSRATAMTKRNAESGLPAIGNEKCPLELRRAQKLVVFRRAKDRDAFRRRVPDH